jgi:hypothetical protein
MYEACKQGYRCVWGEHLGNKIKCSLPKCKVYVGKKLVVDRLQGRKTHRG